MVPDRGRESVCPFHGLPREQMSFSPPLPLRFSRHAQWSAKGAQRFDKHLTVRKTIKERDN